MTEKEIKAKTDELLNALAGTWYAYDTRLASLQSLDFATYCQRYTVYNRDWLCKTAYAIVQAKANIPAKTRYEIHNDNGRFYVWDTDRYTSWPIVSVQDTEAEAQAAIDKLTAEDSE